MIDERFVFAAAILNMWGAATYSLRTLNGKATPNRVTWFLWAFAPLIAFSAETVDHVGLRSLMTFMVGFGPALVFVASFFGRGGYWRISHLDLGCGALSILALVLWGLTQRGDLGILLSIVADFLAALPTLGKSYRAPETEYAGAYRNSALGAGITLATMKSWTLAECAFPLYIVTISALLYVLVRFGRGTGLLRYLSAR